MGLFSYFFDKNQRKIAAYARVVTEINNLEGEISALSSEELADKTKEFRERLANGCPLSEILNEAFAVVREAAKRVVDMRPFDVQMIGALALHEANVIEMKTGEGKTLTEVLPAYVNALEGKGVHIVTVNDYLAKRDAEWMGAIYKFLGMSVGYVVSGMNNDDRREAYEADITYITNSELGFDYLRDNMRYSHDEMVQQKGFNYAIVDEADSVLIDEARTPLIISGMGESDTKMYYNADRIVHAFEEGDYEIKEENRSISINDKGMEKLESIVLEKGYIGEGESLYSAKNMRYLHHVNQSLKAHKIFKKDIDYIVKGNQVLIIDEFTGRTMEGRRYGEGMHQAIEVKENVAVQSESKTLASITYQNLFRMYGKLAGMTGTAKTEEKEFNSIYNLGVVQIPTNMPVARNDMDDEIYATTDEKNNAIVSMIKECNEVGQPVLVGTVSIERSESVSRVLKKEGIKHNVLNAKYHEQEASIIAQAGCEGAVTIATNMAGRGTDIKLGGNAEMRIMEELSNIKDEEYLEKEKERIIREVEENKDKVLKAGGLCVIGTERHESRRIDNQLRGRSGRQGDPGTSKFFLSLEDNLLRVFGSNKIQGFLQKMGLKDGESIEHRWINNAVEKAQKKIEAMNFEVRKSLLKFDDVINEQRQIIFGQRREILKRDSLFESLNKLRLDLNSKLISSKLPSGAYDKEWDTEGLRGDIKKIYGVDFDAGFLVGVEGFDSDGILSEINNLSEEIFKNKIASFPAAVVLEVSRRILLSAMDYLWQGHVVNIDHIKRGINFRALGQKDPAGEFKREIFDLFEAMMDEFRETVVMQFVHVNVAVEDNNDSEDVKKVVDRVDSWSADARKMGSPANEGVSRNAQCPCGSGKRYKHCCGQMK